VLQIRTQIRIHFGQLDPDQDSGGQKKTHKSEENSSFEVRDVLF
jgi:hypothetical protein